jgi:TetR/AcrR family transcriptional repressor of mexJK operon
MGRRLLDLILSADAIGLHRLMIAEASRTPLLREIFTEQVPERVYKILADYLEHQTEVGTLAVVDSHLAPVQFLEMIKGDSYKRGLLGEKLKLSSKERGWVVRHAVDIFLRVRSSASPSPSPWRDITDIPGGYKC